MPLGRFQPSPEAPTAVIGLGRIGSGMVADNARRPVDQRLNFRLFVEPEGAQFVADQIRNRLGNLPSTDEVEAEGDSVVLDSKRIRVYRPKSKDDIPVGVYSEEGIERAVEASGLRTTTETARIHRSGTGVKQVIVTTNLTDGKNILVGKNHGLYVPDEDAELGGGSCTTGSGTEVIDTLEETIGIDGYFLTTGHAYTGKEQRQKIDEVTSGKRPQELMLTDEMHLEKTGGAKGMGVLVPAVRHALKAAVAIRAPVVNGSYTVLNIVLKRDSTEAEVLAALREASERNPDLLLVPQDLAFDRDMEALVAASVKNTAGVRNYRNSGVLAYLKVDGRFCTAIMAYNNEEAPDARYNDLGLFTEGRHPRYKLAA